MAFDFPNSPSTGSTHSVSSGATYVYDGEKWVVSTSFTGTIALEDEIPTGTISSSAQIEAVITDASTLFRVGQGFKPGRVASGGRRRPQRWSRSTL